TRAASDQRYAYGGSPLNAPDPWAGWPGQLPGDMAKQTLQQAPGQLQGVQDKMQNAWDKLTHGEPAEEAQRTQAPARPKWKVDPVGKPVPTPTLMSGQTVPTATTATANRHQAQNVDD